MSNNVNPAPTLNKLKEDIKLSDLNPYKNTDNKEKVKCNYGQSGEMEIEYPIEDCTTFRGTADKGKVRDAIMKNAEKISDSGINFGLSPEDIGPLGTILPSKAIQRKEELIQLTHAAEPLTNVNKIRNVFDTLETRINSEQGFKEVFDGYFSLMYNIYTSKNSIGYYIYLSLTKSFDKRTLNKLMDEKRAEIKLAKSKTNKFKEKSVMEALSREIQESKVDRQKLLKKDEELRSQIAALQAQREELNNMWNEKYKDLIAFKGRQDYYIADKLANVENEWSKISQADKNEKYGNDIKSFQIERENELRSEFLVNSAEDEYIVGLRKKYSIQKDEELTRTSLLKAAQDALKSFRTDFFNLQGDEEGSPGAML